MDSTFGMKKLTIAELNRIGGALNQPVKGRYRVGDKVVARSRYYGCVIETEIIACYDGKYDVKSPRSKWNMTDRSGSERLEEERIIRKL